MPLRSCVVQRGCDMLDFIKAKLSIVIAAVIATLLALVLTFGYMYHSQVKATAAVQQDLTALQTDVDNQNKQISSEKSNHATLDAKTEQSNQQFLDKKRELDGFKGRESVLHAKPTLTEKLINKSFSSFMDEVSCTTGDSTPCPPKR